MDFQSQLKLEENEGIATVWIFQGPSKYLVQTQTKPEDKYLPTSFGRLMTKFESKQQEGLSSAQA